MKDYQKQYPGREMRVFWTTNFNRVVQAQGFSCAPKNPGMFWLPELGFSFDAKFMFDNERAAIVEALKQVGAQIQELTKARDALDARLVEIDEATKPQ